MTGPEQALAAFDGGAAVKLEELTGRWRGSAYPTGHPFDGLLETYGWYGKEFRDDETVHPLLFRDAAGVPRPVNPAHAPLSLLLYFPALPRLLTARAAFALARPLLFTRKPTARLRMVEHRGVLSAALLYDALPVIDHFRRIDDDTLLGLTDMRGLGVPFFFRLRRDVPARGER